MATKTIRVDLAERSYDVLVGPAMLDRLGGLTAGLDGASSAVVIADETVAGLYGEAAVDQLEAEGLVADRLTFPSGESSKTLGTYCRLMDGLLTCDPPIDRGTVIVALGGGVTGDLAGFAAATALRGLRFIQCPTTLLADVDSCVGGKTGVDHPAGKNLIGAFHQPSAVLIDVETLKTLPDEEWRNGLAECVKHAVIRDATLLDLIADNAAAYFARDPDALTDLVARNVAIKGAVVAGDEREKGERAHLNFGHTIGHAVEADAGYALGHGQAVALGMVVENEVAVARGLLDRAVADRVRNVLDTLGLPTRMPGLEIDRLWPIMLRDKKSRAGKPHFILPTALGRVAIYSDVTREETAPALGALS
jgi:3-dehydroquinate synthase